MARMVQRYDLASRSLPPLTWGIAVAIVLKVGALPIAEELAGKETNLTFDFKVSIVISGASIASVIAMWIRARKQKQELERLRERTEELEAENKSKSEG